LDEQALQILAGEPGAATDLPLALRRRSDLVPRLLALAGKPCLWGLWLAARFPTSSTMAAVVARIEDMADEPEVLAALAEALVRGGQTGLGAPLLTLYLRLRPESRVLLLPALESSAGEVRAELEGRRERGSRQTVEPAEAIVLSALLGGSAETLRAGLLALSIEDRAAAVGRLLDREDMVRALPWAEWLASGAEALAPLAAEAAARYRLDELLPALRRCAEQARTLPVLLALGELRDRAAIPLFLRLIEQHPGLRPVALECLGKIGDNAAHESLRRTLASLASDSSGSDVRLAWRALARCAEPRDEPLFRAAASHPDWYVRLVATEVLARSSSQPENLSALALLAADPVSAVSHRALRALES
jgi:hypothetical protein